ncbi:MAG: T9SS type A sorting domain-containing protein, partial [Ignavibacteria bacterium]|nr:T9SS type A sorting domain-containing protein [Ignavibacteria bacterium]
DVYKRQTANNQIAITNGELTLLNRGGLNEVIHNNGNTVYQMPVNHQSGVTESKGPAPVNSSGSGNNGMVDMSLAGPVTINEEPVLQNPPKPESETDDPEYTNGMVIYGIYNDATAAQNYYYNSVYVGGSASSGTANSYTFRKTSPTHVLRNNLFVNARVNTGTATGKHYVMYSVSTVAGSLNTNYNTYIGSDATTIGLWGSTDQTIAQWRTSIASGPGQDKQTWSTVTSSFNVSNLFVDITNGNLNIQAGNQEAWIINGKGIPVTGFGTDYNGNSRSTTISGGVTDIGSHEVAVNHVTNPPPIASFDFAPGSGVTSTYSLWSRNLAVVYWGTGGGSYPSALNVRYYSGVNPPGTMGGGYSNSYWDMTPVGSLSGTDYNILLLFGDNEVYTISTPATNTVLAKYDGTWEVFPPGSGPWQSLLTYNTANQIYNVQTNGLYTFSQFALTDNTNPLPVIISRFDVNVHQRDANLIWVTEREINNKGFAIERRIKTGDNAYSQWKEIAFVNGHGTTNEQKVYKYEDRKLNSGVYQYRLKQVDYNGNFEYYERPPEVADVVIGKPVAFDLGQNYPNPSNPKSKIDFALPFDAKVTIKIYDILGREVATMVDANLTADYYTIEFDGSNLASGTYFYRIVADNGREKLTKTMKMVLVK